MNLNKKQLISFWVVGVFWAISILLAAFEANSYGGKASVGLLSVFVHTLIAGALCFLCYLSFRDKKEVK